MGFVLGIFKNICCLYSPQGHVKVSF